MSKPFALLRDEEIKKLKAENARLRQALEKIYEDAYDLQRIAKAMLEEIYEDAYDMQ